MFTPELSSAFNSKEAILRDLKQMAAAAYSSLVSLMNVLARCQHPTCPVSFDQSKIQTLLDKVTSLVDFLENYHNPKTNRVSVKNLEGEMTRAAHAAEYMIDSYYVKEVLDRNGLNLNLCLTRPYDFSLQADLEKAIRAMDQIVRESDEVGVKKHKSCHLLGSLLSLSNAPDMPIHQEEHGAEHEFPFALTLTPTPDSHLPFPNEVLYDNISTSSSSFPPRYKKGVVAVATNLDEIANPKPSVHYHSSSSPGDKNIVVGSQLNGLMNQIKMHSRKREIITIAGMGGIGKTTLATNAFNSQYARQQFDIRAWVTISQSYLVKNIIVSLLQDIKVEGNDQMDDEQLGDKLYKGLCGRRYLIVLDDIWDIQAWNEIRRFFPETKGSRILLTTRDDSVARRIGSSSTYEMKLLDDDESFNLLTEKVYGPKVFPRELEILGKNIAKSCKGLPLVVVVISGLLKTCSKRMEYWKELAENLSSVISKDESGQCLEILSLSYNHLPIRLKPGFLKMAVFKEDERVNVSNLINLWIAEGFLKPTDDRLSNEIALEYLDDLIDRNLIMVGERGLTHQLETVRMHDSLRELCLREAQNENFVCVVDDNTPNLQQRWKRERRISCKRCATYGSKVFLPSTLHACSLYVTGNWGRSTRISSLQMDLMELVNIRYLSVSLSSNVGAWVNCSLPLHWNLETLILEGSLADEGIFLPSEIWGFPYLRHLKFNNIVLPDPTGGPSIRVLYNLQTIRGVANFFCTDEVFRLIPNLKELGTSYYKNVIDCDKLSNSFNNLALLSKLETLDVHFYNPEEDVPHNYFHIGRPEALLGLRFTFSPTLIELILFGSGIPWEDMTILGCLPNLQVLILRGNAFYGNEWNPIDGEFQCLRYLSIFCCPLTTWNAESYHFPRLESLRFNNLGLKEIPLGIGEITSLQLIELTEGMNISIITSAMEILEERRNNQGDDDDLLVTGYYHGKWSEEVENVKKWTEAEKKCNFLWNSPEAEKTWSSP